MSRAAKLLRELSLNPRSSVGARQALVRHSEKAEKESLANTSVTSASAPTQLTFDEQVLGTMAKPNSTSK